MNTRLHLIIHAALGAAIVASACLILTTSATAPPPAPRVTPAIPTSRQQAAPSADLTAQAYPHLGERDIFGPLIPIPRPIEGCAIPPLPDPPSLARMLEGVEVWTVFGTGGEVKVGEREAVTVEEGGTVELPDNRNRSETIEVEILDIDDSDFEITFRLDWLQPGYTPEGIPHERMEMIEVISASPEPETLWP